MTPAAEALILEHRELVAKVAARVAKRMPPWIEKDELVSAGNVGLVEAAVRFDPERHASFAVFATLRIRGAMIDAYRGRNYPRLMEAMPKTWLQGSADDHFEELGERGCVRTPECLIDGRVSILDLLITEEESVVVCIDAVRARRTLDEVEGRVVDAQLNGESLREIGQTHKKSGTWAHHTVRRAHQKMRLELLPGGKKAA